MEIYWTEKWWRISVVVDWIMRDAIMVKCWTVNEYYRIFIVMWCRCHDRFSRLFIGKFICGTKKVFEFLAWFLAPVWIATAFLDNGEDFNDDPMKIWRHSMLNFPSFSDPLLWEFFMPIKYSQSDEMSNEKTFEWKRESTSVVDDENLDFCDVVGEELSEKWIY